MAHEWCFRGLLLGALALAVCGCSTKRPHDAQPRPFHSDGCTWFPDGDYRDCCEAHDLTYWCGGTRDERVEADRALARCVAGKGHRVLPGLMHTGVRVGGVPWLPTYWRWGFGWRFGRGYTPTPDASCTSDAS